MIRQTRLHRRSDAQSRMDTAEVVPSHIERNGMLQVFQFPAVSIGQASESPKLHPESQVAALNMARADIARIGSAIVDAWDRPSNPARGTVPLRSGNVVAAVELNKLGVIAVPAKVLIHGRDIPTQSVCCKLKPSIHSLAQVLDKCLRSRAFSSANVVREHHLGNAVERKPDILISPLCGSARFKPSLVAAAKSPDFIRLDKLGAESAHVPIPQPVAVRPGSFQQRQDCVFVQSRHTGNGANAHSFQHERQHFRCGIRRGVVGSDLRGRFAERTSARIAAPSLDTALAEVSKSFAGLVLASYAGHGFSPLDFCGESRHNHFGSGVRLTPRSGLAPTSVDAEAGALVQRLIKWWRSDHGLLPAFLKRPALVQQDVSHLLPKSFAAKIRFDPSLKLPRCKIAASVHRATCLSCTRFQQTRNHPFKRGSDRTKWIRLVMPEIESHITQAITNVRNREPFVLLCRKNQSDCILKTATLCLDALHRCLVRLLFRFLKQRKYSSDQLSNLHDFPLDSISFPYQLDTAAQQFVEHLEIVDRLLYVHNAEE